MNEEHIKAQLSNTILVRNLPPNVTTDEITECFSKYGDVMACSLCILSHLNNLYTFHICYVKFDCNDPILDLLENDIDVILNGFILIVEPVLENQIIWSTVVILGIGVCTTQEQVEEALDQINSPKIIKFQEADLTDNGYCIVQYPSKNYVKACLEAHSTFNISNIECGLKPFPPPVFHFIRVSPNALVFQSLKGVEQFNDFTFITPKKKYKCSSMVAAFSCSKIRDLIERKDPILEFQIKIDGDFDVILDAIYGFHVKVTKEICTYVYLVSSILGYDDLNKVASLVCYELLTPQNVIDTYNSFTKDNYPCDYIIEFMATHVTMIRNLYSLPEKTLRQIFRHPLFKSLSPEEQEELLKAFPKLNNLIKTETMQAGSIENDREFLISKLETLEDLLQKAEMAKEVIENTDHPTNNNLPLQQELSLDQMHNDDREQIIRNLGIFSEEVSESSSSFFLLHDSSTTFSDSDTISTLTSDSTTSTYSSTFSTDSY